MPSQDQVQLMATSSVMGLSPETFYELVPFRESWPRFLHVDF